MKTKSILIGFIVTTVLLSACTTTTTSIDQTFNTTDSQSTSSQPESSRLIIGTFQLKGTSNDISPEQAKSLLPLYQMMKTLADSDTAADEEKDAVVRQIKENMTDEQMSSSNGLELTPDTMRTIMQAAGVLLNSGAGNNTAANQSSSGQTGSGSRPAGGPPGDMMFIMNVDGPGGQAGGGQGNISQSQIATLQASQSGTMRSNQSKMLIEAMINYLQTITEEN
jgi:hypothetical protein